MSAIAVFHADYAAHLHEALQAHDAGLPVFLGNPRWTAHDLAEAARQIPRGTVIKGHAPNRAASAPAIGRRTGVGA